jgi:nitrogen regulatory protein P-II 1
MGSNLKRIEAIIQPQRFQSVKEELKKVGISRLTVVDVEGYGRQEGKTEIFRGQEYEINLIPKSYLLLIVKEEELDVAIEAITKGAKTGKIGDGKIIVTPVEQIIRIRTGENGTDAV